MKRRWLVLWLLVVGALAAIWLGIVTGVIAIDPLTNFYLVITAVAVIGILSIIGAVFVGIFITQRVLSSQEFTPFEKEMLAMREDVKQLGAKVEDLTREVAGNPGRRP